MSSKQAKYEAFLMSQQEKEAANFLRDLPQLLEGIAEFIKEQRVEHRNWTVKTLPQLREQYARLARVAKSQKLGHSEYREAVSEFNSMCFLINGYGRLLTHRIALRKDMDPRNYGKAQIVGRFYFGEQLAGVSA